MNRIFENVLTGLVAAGLCLGLVLEANAAEPGARRSAPAAEDAQLSVSYADLELRTAGGMDVLKRRVERAAERVCGSQAVREAGLAQAARNRRCADDAAARALAQILETRLALLQNEVMDVRVSMSAPATADAGLTVASLR